MTRQHPDRPTGDVPMERYEELLADEVLWGLDAAEARELESLTADAEHFAFERVALETTGAALAASLVGAATEQPPADVRARMEAMALHFLASEKGLKLADVAQVRRSNGASERAKSTRRTSANEATPTTDRVASPGRDGGRRAGSDQASRPRLAVRPSDEAATDDAAERLRRRLLVTQLLAAASLLVALGLFMTRGADSPTTSPDAASLYSELVEGRTAQRLVRYEWTMPGGAESPEGEVLWDPELQRGVMTFRGLAPVSEQDALQLWIFDGGRDKAHPVDGGVFDPTRDGTRAADGTLYVPIDAKLAVSEAFAFAVTKESSKGVVVSDRQRIVSLAGQIERL